MFVVRNYVTMGGTVACALAIGYLMQYGPASQRKAAPGSERVASASGHASVLAGIEDVVLTSSPNAETASAKVPNTSSTVSRIHPKVQPNCKLSARASALPGANAQLRIKAPCHETAQVEIHHSGLTFTALTNAQGALTLTIPALSEYAIFLISLQDQTGTVATTHIPDIAEFDRVALQWRGETDLQLHALEFGASYGEAGHVWASPDATGAGTIVHLGQVEANARNVQVYSYPKGTEPADGTIELSVEAEVTKTNCGQDLSVQALQLHGDDPLRSRDLTLTLPDCSRAGEFLVLNNLLEDLTIAAR
ncbi:hypothetical protein [Ruegeria sp.]|uniref:hypothetical protein n=1 Tax=Ruegeria sp. TaxID=1879320 RepID=UPI0023243ADD|nr:hypothetical protein [Ruegeria sp.]MDA7963712.1 hypothetical protein [Ruegeria sp.]